MNAPNKLEDTLCRSCIRSANGIIPTFLGQKYRDAVRPGEFVDRDIQPMAHYRECRTCPMCRLIFNTVCLTPGAEEVSRERGLVVISAEEFGRYQLPDQARPERSVFRLWFSLMLGTTGYTTDVEGTVFSRGVQRLAENDNDVTNANVDDLLLGRHIPRTQIDLHRIRGWIDRCSRWHAVSCSPSSFTASFPMRLIDVKDGCIVVAPNGAKYVALSYMWGTAEQREKRGRHTLCLTRSSIKALMRPGAIQAENEDLPTTISDAITFCKMLEVDYLWVDALCIQQDSNMDKSIQIPKMNLVYGSAYLTIVGAAGEDAWGGLPGVRPNSRNIVQLEESVNGASVISAARPFLASVTKSRWNTRCWTYAEKHLSPRLLIFTEHQVFFQCNESLWYEDAVTEVQKTSIKVSDPPDRYSRSWTGEHKDLPKLSPWPRYRHGVLGYAGRHLSEKRDCLNAFLGVEATLRGELGEKFTWGLPEVILDYALTWRWHGAPSPESRNTHAPSWSWASWLGSMGPRSTAGVEDFYGDPRKARSLVPYFQRDLASAKLSLIRSELPGMSSCTMDDVCLQSDTAFQDERSSVSLPLPAVKLLRPSHCLFLYTQIALLHVDRHRYDGFGVRLRTWTDGSRIPHSRPPTQSEANARRRDLMAPYNPDSYVKYWYFKIRNERRRSIGIVFLDPKWRKKQPDKLEFVAISGFVDPRRVMVILVERKGEDGEEWMERVQLVMNPLEERHWKRCRPMWEWVTLC